jgi:hypothetical protein
MRAFPRGIIDTHVHLGPDVIPRLHDDHGFAHLARQAGYSGFVIKSHVEGTASRAALVRANTWPEGEVLGGIVLNHHVGGLNPWVVEAQLHLGARIVWMPTLSAAAQAHPSSGVVTHLLGDLASSADCSLELRGEDFRDGSALGRICRLIADADAVLATGHLSPDEILRLVPFARECGVTRIFITHPELPASKITLEHERELASYDGVWFERCAVVLYPPFEVAATEIAKRIRATGCERTILASDGGHPMTDPFEGMGRLLEALAEQGFEERELELMTVRNPATALGIASLKTPLTAPSAVETGQRPPRPEANA